MDIMDSQKVDKKPGYYYVSLVDGDRYSLLLGPYTNNHQRALEMVEDVKKKAIELDHFAHFYGFGTCRVDIDVEPRWGVLNDYFPLEVYSDMVSSWEHKDE